MAEPDESAEAIDGLAQSREESLVQAHTLSVLISDSPNLTYRPFPEPNGVLAFACVGTEDPAIGRDFKISINGGGFRRHGRPPDPRSPNDMPPLPKTTYRRHGRPPDLGRLTSSSAFAPAACLASAASPSSPSFWTFVLVVLAIMQGCGRDEAAPHSQCYLIRTQLTTQHLTPFPSTLSTLPLQSGETPRSDISSPSFRSQRMHGPDEISPFLADKPCGCSQGRRSKQLPSCS